LVVPIKSTKLLELFCLIKCRARDLLVAFRIAEIIDVEPLRGSVLAMVGNPRVALRLPVVIHIEPC